MPRTRKLTFASLTFIAFSLVATLSARADTVFIYNGTGNGTFSNGATGTFTGGQQSTSPNGQAFRELPFGNSTATLTINGLAANSLTTLTFNLYGIQSLDGNGNLGNGPDAFNLSANGGTLLNATFSNQNGQTQSYNGTTNMGNNAPGTGRSAQNTLGYMSPGNPAFNDTTYTLSFTAMTNASGSITFTFSGSQNQAPGDESFGLDNILVDGTLSGPPTTPVPEPATMLLLGTGLAGVGAATRKPRKDKGREEA